MDMFETKSETKWLKGEPGLMECCKYNSSLKIKDIAAPVEICMLVHSYMQECQLHFL
jgi:hypothetical protein